MNRVMTRRVSSWIDARRLEAGMEGIDLSHAVAGERHGGANFAKREQARAQSVVDVMRVIGDIVGDRRRLRLETRMKVEVEPLQAVVSEDRARERRAPDIAPPARPRRRSRARCA